MTSNKPQRYGTPFVLALLFFVMALVGIARADVVRVGPVNQFGQGHGHGYVFGSSTDGSCWLATPAHVLRTPQGVLKDNVLLDTQGRAGVATRPVQPDKSVDLAFARVSGLGRNCLDRLSSRCLDNALVPGSAARLNLIDTGAGGARAMPLRIRTVDGGKYAIKFSVEPIASAADTAPRIQQGFSGGMIDRGKTSTPGDGSLLLGLVLSVCSGKNSNETINAEDVFGDDTRANARGICGEGHYATALRFDEIRRLFYQTESRQSKSTNPQTLSIHPDLLNFSGNTIAGTPANLTNGQTCWTVQPDAKGRVRLDYIMPEGVKSTAIVIEACEGRGNVGGVEVRGGTSVGETTAYRYCTAVKEKLRCTIGSRKASVIRLAVTPKVKNMPLKLLLVRIETAPI